MGQALLYLRIDIFQRVFGKRGWGRRRPCSTCTLYARSWQLSVRKNNNREKWNLVCRTEFAPFLFFLFRSGCFFFLFFFHLIFFFSSFLLFMPIQLSLTEAVLLSPLLLIFARLSGCITQANRAEEFEKMNLYSKKWMSVLAMPDYDVDLRTKKWIWSLTWLRYCGTYSFGRMKVCGSSNYVI